MGENGYFINNLLPLRARRIPQVAVVQHKLPKFMAILVKVHTVHIVHKVHIYAENVVVPVRCCLCL